MIYWFFLIGLVLLVWGGDLVVRGAVTLAQGLGVSALLVSLTVVGLGTSMPEMVVSIRAALAGAPGIVVGNVVGSNIANSLLVMGLAALIYPMRTPNIHFRRDAIMVIVSALILTLIVFQDVLERMVGIGLVAMVVLYFIYAYLTERDSAPVKAEIKESVTQDKAFQIFRSLVFITAGLAMVIIGAKWVVNGALSLAVMAGISETVIGLTIVAVGTSLPELATALMAAMRGQTSVVFGNILGSNIQNILTILGVTAIVQPISIPDQIAHLDIWVMLGATFLMLGFAITKWRLNRVEGGIMLTAYFLYLGYLAYVENIGRITL